METQQHRNVFVNTWDGVKSPAELTLIMDAYLIGRQSKPNWDALHALNIRLLLSRYSVMTLTSRERAVHSMRNLLSQIQDPEIAQAVDAEIMKVAITQVGEAYRHGHF